MSEQCDETSSVGGGIAVEAFEACAPQTWAQASWPLGAHEAGRLVVTAEEILSGSVPPVRVERGHRGFCEDVPAEERVGCTFAVYAPRAQRVLLEFYAEAVGVDAAAEFDMARGEDGVWRARVQGPGHGTLYGFRCWGPNWVVDPQWCRGGSAAGFVADVDEVGDRFNPNKVLFDPYAREITHNLASDLISEHGGCADVFATGGVEVDGRARRELDSGRWAPKGVIVLDGTSTGARPFTHISDAIIYETHLQGLTAHPSSVRLPELLADVAGFGEVVGVPDELRGTYAGAAYMAPYLRALGVTTIEFLPVQESTSRNAPVGPEDPRENYWGYTTLAYFAPNRAYAHDRSLGGPTREFKDMVAAFHDAGIEVYVDVVYNHSGEGGHWEGDLDTVSFTSLGGFSTSEYYVLTAENRLVDGATGVSNQMNFSSSCTAAVTLDSLAYWLHDMGVDGFRFDLAPVLGRKPDEAERDDWEEQRRFFDQHPVLIGIARLGELAGAEVIAEAWDLWGYEVGNFPPGWSEWNGRFRDAVRRFTKGDANTDSFIDMMNGDYEHFYNEKDPGKSINFVTAHDGFTMMDLVSYNGKTNEALTWPFGPSDGGSDDNESWDSGGDQALRRTRLRNFLAILMFSRGVPMIVGGDEYGRGQNGNNNPWNLNSVGMWNNWAQAGSNAPMQLLVDPDDPENGGMYYDVFGVADCRETVNPILVFTRALTWIRHTSPELRQRYWGAYAGEEEVQYLFRDPSGRRWTQPGDRALQVRLGTAQSPDGDFVLLINMEDHEVEFTFPSLEEPCAEETELVEEEAAGPGGRWERLIDTAPWAERFYNVFGSLATAVRGQAYADQVREAIAEAEAQGMDVHEAIDSAAGVDADRVPRDYLDGDRYRMAPWSIAVARQTPPEPADEAESAEGQLAEESELVEQQE
ncbi:Isoamylase precursor [Dermatophilus congolensis]|uniref:Isoamylase n=1 Tax=Dermatophilus congolensis TaxID=1863 RepID=A0AA46BQA6_9MICO|nr:alpha-amylase family glycosyl hydrolase [Dermatophilus congolensis]STD15340.1 Isoamylase precursor [Dermatophilus congolensis]